jgi:hypothetical protein
MKSILLANILSFIHLLLVLFVVFGIFIVPTKHLPLFIIFLTLILFSWLYFELCILTKLEHYFKYGEWYNPDTYKKNPEEAPGFVKSMLESILGFKISKNITDKINHTIILLALIASSLKIWYS